MAQPRAWIDERRPGVVDRSVRDAAARVLDACEDVNVAGEDRVLTHGDLGLHNITVDAATDDLIGVFDYDSASWADRHHDFRHLLFDDTNEVMLEAALREYEPAAGRTLNRPRIRLYNSAVSFLAYRHGVAATEQARRTHLGRGFALVRIGARPACSLTDAGGSRARGPGRSPPSSRSPTSAAPRRAPQRP